MGIELNVLVKASSQSGVMGTFMTDIRTDVQINPSRSLCA